MKKLVYPAVAAIVAAIVLGACAQPDPVYIYVEQPTPTPTPKPRVVTKPRPAPNNSPESFDAVTRPQSYSN